MRYFDHDTTASGDDLVLALRIEHGGAAVDCFWAVLEQIYREESEVVIDRNRPETKALCVRLLLDYETLENYVSTMCDIGLLEVRSIDENGCKSIMSERAEQNIEAYQRKCEIARQNGSKGGRKPKRNQSANQTETKSVSKRQAKKRKEKKDIGLDKPNQISSGSDGGGADETAPPSPQDDTKIPCCPLCSKPIRFDPVTFKWRCAMCGEVKAPDYKEVAA